VQTSAQQARLQGLCLCFNLNERSIIWLELCRHVPFGDARNMTKLPERAAYQDCVPLIINEVRLRWVGGGGREVGDGGGAGRARACIWGM
jgi:hypothetical protein